MLPARERDDGRASEEDGEASGRPPLGLVRVGAREQLVGVWRVGRVGDAQVLGADEIDEHAHETVVQLLGREGQATT